MLKQQINVLVCLINRSEHFLCAVLIFEICFEKKNDKILNKLELPTWQEFEKSLKSGVWECLEQVICPRSSSPYPIGCTVRCKETRLFCIFLYKMVIFTSLKITLKVAANLPLFSQFFISI